ncbi:hypothetical protein GIB67_014193 [Kingdonia uniflora]|uniref:Uncharacterized protein n=1 Tax=Kingdonia uniflora TaxID=39325 RepID=A0A7J7M1V1_9MAGN|nr:hypothetical protein GIB67_014193 [Kingdonia uniflora]
MYLGLAFVDALSPKKKKLRHGHPQNITVEHKESIEHRKEEMVLKVNENVDLIHSILLQNMLKSRENMPDDSKNTEAETMEFRRWQADELIKVLGNLSGILDQLTDLVKQGGKTN